VWTVAADKGGFFVAFEKSQALSFEVATQILHQLHGEPLLTLHFRAEEPEQWRSQELAGDVARYGCFRYRHGSGGGVILQKMGLHFGYTLQGSRRLRAFRQRFL
jgi:hypothetical protein